MFHDASGRRRHLVAVAGCLAAVLTAFWLCAMIVGATGFATLPSLREVLAAHRNPWHRHRIVAASARPPRATLIRAPSISAPQRAVTDPPDPHRVPIDLQ